MSCGPAHEETPAPDGWRAMLGHEGFRLFFPLGAIYTAIWPLMWVLALGFDLPLAREVPPSLWHAHEMMVGAFGAALIGFLTTAAPEWTDTEPMRGRPLWILAALWAAGRVVGIWGWDALGAIGALADLAWMAALLVYLLRLSIRRRTDRLLAFAFWLALFAGAIAATRFGFLIGDIWFATSAITQAGLAFLGLLGLALSRITVPVTNLVLDPSEESSPFRPHPGRLNLAPGLVLVVMAGEAWGLSPAVSAYLYIAAGAAFIDRVGEAFIGREMLRTEILLLAGSSAMAGIGMMLIGAARLGAPWSDYAGMHLGFMGGLGLGVYAVFCIAGLLHSGRDLGLHPGLRLGALILVASSLIRVAPEFGFDIPGPLHGAAALAWGGAFAIWLWRFWPIVSQPGADEGAHCA